MKINEKQIAITRMRNTNCWDEFQTLMCFLRLWQSEKKFEKLYNEWRSSE